MNKKIIALISLYLCMFQVNSWTQAPLPKPNSQEFGILLGANYTMPFDMHLFGFNSGSPYNNSFAYSNIPAGTLKLTEKNPGYFIGLSFNALKGWNGKCKAEFNTDMGRQTVAIQVPTSMIRGGGLIRIIFYREKKGDKLYEYKYMIQDLTGAK
jgi:hypothetical protein